MKIGSFLDANLGKNVSYSYYHKGTSLIYNPDVLKEEFDKEVYFANDGNLFYGIEVSWKDSALLKGGIDIDFKFDGKCFVDHVDLTQGDKSKIKNIEIFTKVSGKLKKIGTYAGETGIFISENELNIPVGFYAENLILRLNGNCSPIAIKNLNIWGAWEIENTIWPLPENASFSGIFELSTLKTVKAVGDDEKFAAKYLTEKFLDKTGKHLEIVDENGDITLGIKEFGKNDSYKLSSKNGKCCLIGNNRRSLLYSVDALIQLIDGDYLKETEIKHEAFCELRGVHFGLPHKSQLDFIKNMVKYVFVPCHYNMAFIEIGGGMVYEKFPEISQTWNEWNKKYESDGKIKPAHYKFVSKDPWEKTEISEFCSFLESYGLEVVPEVQSLGHTQYITYAHPEMTERTDLAGSQSEIDLNTADVIPEGDYHCMCPNHPEYYNMIFGVLDEVIEACSPKRFVHMGHDEVVTIGKCERCREFSRADIFAKEVNELNKYIKAKNLNMMIWSDMLQKDEYYAAPKAIDKIDKDIIMLDFVWYFHVDDDIEDPLLSRGFKVMIGNMYTSHYPRFEKRIRKKGMIGGEVSTWSEATEFSYASAGKMYELLISAAPLSSSSYDSSFALTYNEIIKPLLKNLRERIGGLKWVGEVETAVNINGEAENVPFDIKDIVTYRNAHLLSESQPQKEILVNNNAKMLTVIHACLGEGKRVTGVRLDAFKTAEYEIVYDDKTSYTESIFYAANIHNYRWPYGKPADAMVFRHIGYAGTYLAIPECGKTHNGEDYTLYAYSFKNPEPEKKIKALKLKYCSDAGVDSVIFDLKIKN